MSPHEIETGVNVRERYDGTSVTCRYEVDVRLPSGTGGGAIKMSAYEALRGRCRRAALDELSRLLAPGGDAE